MRGPTSGLASLRGRWSDSLGESRFDESAAHVNGEAAESSQTGLAVDYSSET